MKNETTTYRPDPIENVIEDRSENGSGRATRTTQENDGSFHVIFLQISSVPTLHHQNSTKPEEEQIGQSRIGSQKDKSPPFGAFFLPFCIIAHHRQS